MTNAEQIARVCHEVNRAYCSAIGDGSQVPYDDAPQWQRDSDVSGVQHAIENPEAPPSSSHDNWLKDKAADGWKYGPVKNPDAKEHPCFVPYEELPMEQRIKDHLFVAVVKAMTIKTNAATAAAS